MINENFRTMKQLMKFKYFESIFVEINNEEEKIYGYYVDITKDNLPLVKSYIRFMYPSTFIDKIKIMSVGCTVLIRRGSDIHLELTHIRSSKKNLRHYWSFEYGLSISMIISNILINRTILEQHKKMLMQNYLDMSVYSQGFQPIIMDYPTRI